MRRAACVLIFNQDKVLAISRGQDTSNWGLPGGKVERRETLVEAARNELREETGVMLDIRAILQPIYTDISSTHIVTTFGVNGRIFYPHVLQSNPFEGYVDFKKPHELCTENCSFAPYHRRLFSKLNIDVQSIIHDIFKKVSSAKADKGTQYSALAPYISLKFSSRKQESTRGNLAQRVTPVIKIWPMQVG